MNKSNSFTLSHLNQINKMPYNLISHFQVEVLCVYMTWKIPHINSQHRCWRLLLTNYICANLSPWLSSRYIHGLIIFLLFYLNHIFFTNMHLDISCPVFSHGKQTQMVTSMPYILSFCPWYLISPMNINGSWDNMEELNQYGHQGCTTTLGKTYNTSEEY